MARSIVHLDADAFFAAVEQAADPRLRDRPVAVGGERRGIIASASYEARKFGIYTPMPTARARKLCPQLIVLPGDYERYEQFSRWMFGYCYDFTPDVEQTSIDEGYFDLTANRKQPPVEIALTIRQAIRQSLKLVVSEGLGTNKLVSAIASKFRKPAAFESVPAGGERQFLEPLPNRWLPGIGPQTAERLNAAGLAYIGQIALMSADLLALVLGSQAPLIRQFARGVDERPLIPARESQKSYSQQETFPEDVTDEDYVEAVLRRMADRLFAQVRAEGRSVRTLAVKVRYNDRDEAQRAASLREPTDLETDVYGRLRGLLREAWQRRVSLRMVSLKLSNVYDGVFRSELPLENHARNHAAQARLATVVDELRHRKGWSVVMRGHDLRLASPPREAIVATPGLTPTAIRRRIAPARIDPSLCVPLRVHSHYSFLDSTLSPERIIALAKQHDLPAVALTDTGNLHGAVEFVQAARAAGVKPILGMEVRTESQPLLLYVESTTGYHNLCCLLSRHAELVANEADETAVVAQQRRPFRREEFVGLTDGLIAVTHDTRLAELFPRRFYRPATAREMPADFPVVACPAIHYATPAERQRYDILQSIRTLTLLGEQHPEKRTGGWFHFRAPAELTEACGDHPEWLQHAREIAERCNFAFPFGKPQFPAFVPPDGSAASDFLRRLVEDGAQHRYPPRTIARHPPATRPGTGYHQRGRLRRILPYHLGLAPGLPPPGYRVDHPRQCGGQPRLLLSGDQRCLSGLVRPLFPPVLEQGAHGLAQAARH